MTHKSKIHHEEYLDLVDEYDKPLGKKELRSIVHTQGLWHRIVRVYFYRIVKGEIQFIVHLRSKGKDRHPNKWDSHFGGHPRAGESIEQSIENEILEETGLKIDRKKLITGSVCTRDFFPDRAYAHSYYYKYLDDINNLKFDDGEVQEAKWMLASEICSALNNEPEKWAPHYKGFLWILDDIKMKLKE